MDRLQYILSQVLSPLMSPILPGERIYWLYIGSALIIAFAVYLATYASRRVGLIKGFITYCFPKNVFAHKSAIVDYKYFLINKMTFAILFAPLIIGSSAVSGWSIDVLGFIWGPAEPGGPPGVLTSAVLTICAILAMDGAIFIAHYLQHTVPVLWEFHKVHHSAEVLTPITAYRIHPVGHILTGIIAGVLVGVVQGAFGYFYGDRVGLITLMQVNIVLFVFYVGGYNLRHSHIWLSYPRWLSHILISPAQHQIHHSADPKHFNKNIAFIFAFWDYFAGTLYVPSTREDLTYGLYNDEHKAFDGVFNLYFQPFKNVAAHFPTTRKQRAK